MKRLFRKIGSFFNPVPGWKIRFREFQAGRRVWDVPGRPQCPKVIPFPIEWFPHRLSQDEDTEEEKARGFVFLDSLCIDTGKEIKPGVATLCLRCGVPLHPDAAHMMGGFDPPYCRRCRWPLLIEMR